MPHDTEPAARGYRLPAAALMAAVALLVGLVPAAGIARTGALLTSDGTASLSVTSAAACASGTPYAKHLMNLAQQPAFWWRFGEAAGATTVADSTSAGLDGKVAGADPSTAVALGDPGLPQCDTTGSLHLLGDPTGDTGFVVLPTAQPEPRAMSVAVWVQAAAGASGGLLSFGDSDTGLSATTDRLLALDGAGRVTFQVATSTGPVTVHSSVSDDVTDGNPHLVAATVSSGAPGQYDIGLYVDGAQVDQATGVVLASPFTGYWRTGDADGPGAPAHLDELAVWEGGSLTAPDIAALHAADHW